MDGNIEIDVNNISKSAGNMLGDILCASITNYFSDPLHQKEFEDWKRERRNTSDIYNSIV